MSRDALRRLAAALPDGGRDARFVRAPGRVNLIGDHTDYQDGFCLPMAIDREVTVAFAARADGRAVLRSVDLPGVVDLPADGTAEPTTVEPQWGRLVAGVLRVLAGLGRAPVGLDAVVASRVPIGSGLSSSAAFEVAITLASSDVAGFTIDPTSVARAAQTAEHVATGVPCGIMDQLASVAGRAGAALLLDCRSLTVEPLPLPRELEVLVVHSGVARALVESEYAARRAACEAAAARLGVAALRDATVDEVATDPIARHVVSENARTVSFAAALRRGDVDTLGTLMDESHASLRDDFDVSTPELDLLVDMLREAGARGARMTGAGFGGCVVALVAAGALEEVAGRACDRYRAATGREPTAFRVEAVDGAGPAPAP